MNFKYSLGSLPATMLSSFADASSSEPSVPEIPFDSVPNVLKLPEGVFLGEPAGVAINSQGHIFVYCRTGTVQLTTGTSMTFVRGNARLREFDQNGNFLREIGKNLYGFLWAERVRVDPEDNIWVIDSGANMVIKFDPELHVLMTLGRKPEAIEVPTPVENGTEPKGYGAGIPGDSFIRPTDVAWDAAGDIFVSDGHGHLSNARIAKFDKDGRFIKSWGSKGEGPGQFDTPHSIAVDRNGNVYVADRSNNRIQVFDNDGNFKTQWTQQGTPFSICISSGQHQYLYSLFANFPQSLDHGQIYKMELDGTILGKFGKAGGGPKEFGSAHSINCSPTNENELYIAEFNKWRVHKVTLHP